MGLLLLGVTLNLGISGENNNEPKLHNNIVPLENVTVIKKCVLFKNMRAHY